jgi:hypothetical protein
MLNEIFLLPQDLGDGTTLKVEPIRINQDQYSSEYLLIGALASHRIKVRHSVAKATATLPARDRHNVEVVETVFATATEVEIRRLCYMVTENVSADAANTDLNVFGIAEWFKTGTNYADLTGWES